MHWDLQSLGNYMEITCVFLLLKKLVERPSKCKEVKSDCCCCSFDIINQTERNAKPPRIQEEDGVSVWMLFVMSASRTREEEGLTQTQL